MNLRRLPWLLAVVGMAVPLVGSGFALWPFFVSGLILLAIAWVIGRSQRPDRRGRIGFALVLLPFLFLAGIQGGWWLIPADLAWLVIEVMGLGPPEGQPALPGR